MLEDKEDKENKTFREITGPVIEQLNNHFNPHAQIIIGTTHATWYQGKESYITEEFVKN